MSKLSIKVSVTQKIWIKAKLIFFQDKINIFNEICNIKRG